MNGQNATVELIKKLAEAELDTQQIAAVAEIVFSLAEEIADDMIKDQQQLDRLNSTVKTLTADLALARGEKPTPIVAAKPARKRKTRADKGKPRAKRTNGEQPTAA
ncbi:MAG: hypothetical protein AABY75_05610 [Bacteroidota bacterium]